MQPDLVTEEMLSSIVQTVAAMADVKRILLYGSRAAGMAEPDSDIDLLVVESGSPDKLDERTRLLSSLPELPVSVDLWVMGQEEFDETKNVIGGLAYPAHKYGRVLHAKP